MRSSKLKGISGYLCLVLERVGKKFTPLVTFIATLIFNTCLHFFLHTFSSSRMAPSFLLVSNIWSDSSCNFFQNSYYFFFLFRHFLFKASLLNVHPLLRVNVKKLFPRVFGDSCSTNSAILLGMIIKKIKDTDQNWCEN